MLHVLKILAKFKFYFEDKKCDINAKKNLQELEHEKS